MQRLERTKENRGEVGEGKWELMGNDQASSWQARRLSVVFGWMVPLSKAVRTQGFSDLVHKSEGRKAKNATQRKSSIFSCLSRVSVVQETRAFGKA